jgi:hypothetical protein
MPISDYERDRRRRRERPLPVTNPPKDPAGSQRMRDELARKRTTRDGKLARVFASPAQVSRTAEGIVIAPRGETTLEAAQREAEAAQREAKEARAAAEEAKTCPE